MPQYQPRPMVVIRNQLLAFLVLHLLGSCVPIQSIQPSIAVVAQCCSPNLSATEALDRHSKQLTPNTRSR